MTWEWSHTNEAYENAYNNLKLFSLSTLQEIWCEIQTFEQCESEANADDFFCNDDQWKDTIYYQHKARVTDQHDLLVDWIWEWASNWRQCDNGAFNLHLCPYGCHTVSVDNEEIEKDGI